MAATRLSCPLATHRTKVTASGIYPLHRRCPQNSFVYPLLSSSALYHSGQHGTTTICAAGNKTISVSDSLDILELDSATATDADELKKAYYKRMREIHPDVNPEQDTTESAALVNAAYAALLKVCPLSRPTKPELLKLMKHPFMLAGGRGICIWSGGNR